MAKYVEPHEVRYSGRLIAALAMAGTLHYRQVRKGLDTPAPPYLCHLLAVASLVLEAGGDEDTTIAALLHDAVGRGSGELALQAPISGMAVREMSVR
ncbi:MAG: HD domain-containing protein [Candidatus Sericytochromatia bacterium]|nr:HD domain-containing protein [Candidatus Tanganyikabacteria bacterium]